MKFPDHIKLKEPELPPRPGVYFMKDAAGAVLYVGKATSLKTRVASYFVRPADERIAHMVTKIRVIDWQETSTTIEALVFEAKYIKKLQPPYNVREKDDRSQIYLVFTKENYPRPVLIRESELIRLPKRGFLKVFGPFKSATTIQAALDALRRAFPWSTCQPSNGRACFYVHLGQCPGVCTGAISSRDYKNIIRGLIKYFDGKSGDVLRQLKRNMQAAAKRQDFESAARYRDRLWALEHVHDVAVIKREFKETVLSPIDIYGRIEGYDISNISGDKAVGSMVVFEDGRPRKNAYRKFKIKTISGPNDIAMLIEVLHRRFSHKEKGKDWSLPNLILVDGGRGQVNAARKVLQEFKLKISVVGLAKGFDRKQDELVYDETDYELARLARAFRPLLQQVRDEAHRFAVSYHRQLRRIKK